MEACVFLADTFEGVANAGGEDPWYRGGEHADTSADIVRDLADRLGVDVTLLEGMFPEDTGDDDRRTAHFRLVHIDVDVYESAKRTFEWAWPRLVARRGRRLRRLRLVRVRRRGDARQGAVRCAARRTSRLLHNLNGHLVVIKLPDAVRATGDDAPIAARSHGPGRRRG